jgi:hypothetical protein
MAQNEEMRQRMDDVKRVYDTRIDALWEQIHLKDKRMDEKDDIIRRLMDKCL